MQYRGISKAALARETGRPVAVINAILDGVAQITTQFAMQLEVLTDVPAQFWLEADKRFRRLQARTRVAPERKPTFTAHTNHAPRCIRITLEEL
jgi:plasmid maintenance system antidote protein VapI